MTEDIKADAENVMKRCQIGTKNYNEANNLHAECYGTIGRLLLQVETLSRRLFQMQEAAKIAGAEAEKQEPVAWGIANTRPTERNPLMMVMLDEPAPSHLVMPLYTHPQPKREWVGLTDEEMKHIEETTTCLENESWLRNLTRNIEAKLKEKNT